MGDPWKSINQEGVRAFTYGVGATILIWLSGEGYLEPVVSFLTIIGFRIIRLYSLGQARNTPLLNDTCF